jgi:hypothetical protein
MSKNREKKRPQFRYSARGNLKRRLSEEILDSDALAIRLAATGSGVQPDNGEEQTDRHCTAEIGE